MISNADERGVYVECDGRPKLREYSNEWELFERNILAYLQTEMGRFPSMTVT